MWNLDLASLAAVAVRTVVIYLVILVLLRVAGKRELGQMTPFDLVVMLLLANAVQNGMVGSDASLTGALVSAVSIVAANSVVGRVGLRSEKSRERWLGTPTLLVHDGSLVQENLRREGVPAEAVMQALRQHGVDSLQQAKTAVLEIDGTISVIPADAKSSRTRRRVSGRKPAP
jgi:uncharacterized membrane protein YcaP (DUF421 family)